MPLTAHHFIVTRPDTHRVVGHALLCPAAHYASTRVFGAPRLVRGRTTVDTWAILRRDLAIGWEKGLVPARDPVARVLLPGDLEVGRQLQKLVEVPIEAAEGGAAEALDRYLKGLPER